MEYALLLGRILYGGFFFASGIGHFTHVSMMSGYAASKGVPAPKLAVAGSGIMLLGAGASVLLGVYVTAGLSLIILFLLPVSFMMHNFWAVTDAQARQIEQVMFMKNMALAGSALMLLALPMPWPLTFGW